MIKFLQQHSCVRSMSEHIHKCLACMKYTMEKKCPLCGAGTVLPRPPKFSLEDKYAGYRRDSKKKELIQKGLY